MLNSLSSVRTATANKHVSIIFVFVMMGDASQRFSETDKNNLSFLSSLKITL